jgi:5'-nucleotidase
MKRLFFTRNWLAALVLWLALACTAEVHENPVIEGQDIKLTFLHTSDIHSRIFPYRMKVIYTDEQLGLDQAREPFGGVARLSWLINRERARNPDRTLYLDGGDYFEGAPVFNVFLGEAEVRAMSQMNPDASLIGNHEFDKGLANLANQLWKWASFPVLGANYLLVPGNPLEGLLRPYSIVQVGGLKVGIIGVANFSSLSSITDAGNSLGIVPVNIEETVQEWIDTLRPMVDLVVILSHGGFSEDEAMVGCTSGVDIVFGGHTHLALMPPKVIKDGLDRDVLVVHSGAFAKYLGKLDVVVRDKKVVSHTYELLPVDSSVPEDPKMVELLEPYRLKLNQTLDLVSVFSYAGTELTKYGFEGGDSSLGNLVADAMRGYARVDLAFNNTLGIRANIYPGVITVEDLYNVFPFENSVTTMMMSGRDLLNLFDYNTDRSAGRGCVSQLQIAGIELTMDCNRAPSECQCRYVRQECPGVIAFDSSYMTPDRCKLTDDISPVPQACAEACECPPGATRLGECRCPPMVRDVYLSTCSDPLITDKTGCTREPLDLNAMYEVATNDYIANGGSGFIMLRSNNTQVNTHVPVREAVQERIIRSGKCVDLCQDEHGANRVRDCSVFNSCAADIGRYLNQFCTDIDQSSEDPAAVPEHCALPPAPTCKKTNDCYDVAAMCQGVTPGTNGDGPSCTLCTSPAQCTREGEGCVNGHCVPGHVACLNAHCVVRCDKDEDCQDELQFSEQVSTCVNGACVAPHRVACLTDGECTHGTAMCFAGSPTCAVDADCTVEGQVCAMGFCQPARTVCTKAEDCPNGVACAFGYCDPFARPCASDGECPGGACVGGACNAVCGNCVEDRNCPKGLVCSENRCVPANGHCVENRCRAVCADDTQCLIDEACVAGTCVPDVCLAPQSPETQCRVQAEYNATQRCLQVPCVRSAVDGRIKRILPKNTGGYHDKEPINDPEDTE